MKKYTIGIPITANENNTIRQTMSSLEKDLLLDPLAGEVETIICLNKYNSETEKIIDNIDCPTSHCRKIYSEPGLLPAQRKVIEEAGASSDFVLFYDGDILIAPGSTKKMMDFMEKKPEVHAASGDQIAQKVNSFWYQTYNILGLNPQIKTPRKYLTGRIFAIRKKDYGIPGFLVSDDVFLSHFLMDKYGGDAVQTVPGASVEYRGPGTFRDYFQKRRRIGIEKGKMFEEFPELKELRSYLDKHRVPEQIAALSKKEKLQLLLHDGIKKICSKAMGFTSNKEVWVPLSSTKELK